MSDEDLTDNERQQQIDKAWAQHNEYHPTTKPSYRMKRGWLRVHFHDQNGICPYCKGEMILELGKDYARKGEYHWSYATLDHVIPKSEGGPDTFENTNAACNGCNNAKHSFPPELFLTWCEYAIQKYDDIAERRQYLRLESAAELYRLQTTFDKEKKHDTTF